MRTARFTYKGAYHHIMTRGLNKSNIFLDDHDRKKFIWLLSEKIPLYHINVFAHCLLTNHYHLVLCNTSGRMGDFMRVLNGGYASYFRRKHGGKGYLFEDRYKSILVENETYLYRVIQYTLVNPYTAGIVDNPFNYKWSSINSYFDSNITFLDTSLVREMFEDKNDFIRSILENKGITIESAKGKFGYYIGSPSFEKAIEEKFNRRKETTNEHPLMRRKGKEFEFLSPNIIIKAFKDYYDVHHLEDFLSESSYKTKRKVDLLIKLLKDECGLNYRELSRYLGLRFNSLPNRYLRTNRKSIPNDLLKKCKVKNEI